MLLHVDAPALGALLVSAALGATAFHAYLRQRRGRRHLEFLYTSMRAIQSAPNLRLATHELLQAARLLLSAEVAELVIVQPGSAAPVRSTIDGNAERLLEATEVTPALEQAIGGGEPDAYLDERGFATATAAVARIRGELGLSGVLIVGARTAGGSFSGDDSQLLETFASHVSAVLEHDQAREQLQYQAHHDDLTGLANRGLFTARCAEALAVKGRRTPAILFLDLDDFKTINDSLGHGAGDDLLVAVADRIRACAGADVLAARLGGDEFALLLPSATLAQAERLAVRLLASFDSAIVLDGREFRIHPSIGIASSQGPETTAEELLRNADVAMYSAKDGGKRRFARYETEMHARARRRQELASDLERAIERHELTVQYQPILELGTGRLFALEALARWEHPEHGVLPPGVFIPLAEETGLIGAIGRLVRHDACSQLADWRKLFPDLPDLSVTVNLSPPELQDRELRREIESILAQSGLPARNLILEMTESSAVQDPQVTIGHLRDLRRLGVRVALDDFGTGYSSLSHLRDLPLDVIKIAKPFVDDLAGSRTAEHLLTAILQLAHALSLEVVAEGIQKRVQAEILERLGCRLVQGYLYSRPMTAAAAGGYLRGVPKVKPRPVTPRVARARPLTVRAR